MKKKITINLDSPIAIVFIVLKLTKVINWSWLWVLCPIWISFLLLLILFLIEYYGSNR